MTDQAQPIVSSYELDGVHFSMNPIPRSTVDDLIVSGKIDAALVHPGSDPTLTSALKPFRKVKPNSIGNGHYLVVTPIFLKKTRTAHEYVLYKIHPLGRPCKYDTASYK